MTFRFLTERNSAFGYDMENELKVRQEVTLFSRTDLVGPKMLRIYLRVQSNNSENSALSISGN